MQNKDRLWWLWIPGGILGLGGIVALTVFFVPLIHDRYLFGSPLMNGFELVIAYMLLIPLTVTAPAQASQSRGWAHARAAALHGDAEAMPRANIPTDPAQAPDVSVAPLVLLWQPARFSRILHRFEFVLCLAIGGTLVATLLPGIFTPTYLIYSDSDFPFPDASLIVPPFVAVFFIGVLFYSWCWVRGKSFGIIASEDGVQMRSIYGWKRFIPWRDMRLFEVSRQQEAPADRLTYRLYGPRAVITWTHPATTRVLEPTNTTDTEMSERVHELPSLIHARTGLVPRTFEQSLQVSPTARRTRLLRRTSTSLVFFGWLSLIMFWLLVGSAIWYLPLTTSPGWNLFFLLVPLLAVLLSAIRSLAVRRPDPQAPAVLASLAAPPPVQTTFSTKFALAYTASRRQRLVGALRAAPFALMGVPTLLLLVSGIAMLAGIAPDQVGLPRVPTIAAIVLAVLLEAFAGLAGQIGLFRSLRPVSHLIVAGATGLSALSGTRESEIPWSWVGEIAARERQGKIILYYVRIQRANPGEITVVEFRDISWSARHPQMRVLAPPARMTTLTPDELAALVAQRSGKEIHLL